MFTLFGEMIILKETTTPNHTIFEHRDVSIRWNDFLSIRYFYNKGSPSSPRSGRRPPIALTLTHFIETYRSTVTCSLKGLTLRLRTQLDPSVLSLTIFIDCFCSVSPVNLIGISGSVVQSETTLRWTNGPVRRISMSRSQRSRVFIDLTSSTKGSQEDKRFTQIEPKTRHNLRFLVLVTIILHNHQLLSVRQ